MNIKKSLLVAGAAATISVAGLSGLGIASAATSGSSDSLAGKIAAKFGLKEAEVQAVFDQEKAERNAERQAEMSNRLQAAVDDGSITAAQKTLIENKLRELAASHEAEAEELEQWAEAQGVDLKYLKMLHGPFGGDDDRLQDAVDDGKITAAQKTAIEAKQNELKDKREAARDELQKWAEDNGIGEQYLMFGKKVRMEMGGPKPF